MSVFTKKVLPKFSRIENDYDDLSI